MARRILAQPISAEPRHPVGAPSAGLHPNLIHEDDPKRDNYCLPFLPPKTSEKTGKTTVGRSHTGSCPISWGWKGSKPVLRFCTGHRQPGRIIPVDDAIDALEKGRKICEEWYRRTGPLVKPKRGSRPINERFQILAREMSEAEPLKQYALGRSKRRTRRSR